MLLTGINKTELVCFSMHDLKKKTSSLACVLQGQGCGRSRAQLWEHWVWGENTSWLGHHGTPSTHTYSLNLHLGMFLGGERENLEKTHTKRNIRSYVQRGTWARGSNRGPWRQHHRLHHCASIYTAKVSNNQITIHQNNHSWGWVCMYNANTVLLILRIHWKQWLFKRMWIFNAWS